MTEKLSENQLNRIRPKPSESKTIHQHTNKGNIGWILVNGRYLSNQEVEALEAERDKIREDYLEIWRIGMGWMHRSDELEVRQTKVRELIEQCKLNRSSVIYIYELEKVLGVSL